jgi:hypothetical protein
MEDPSKSDLDLAASLGATDATSVQVLTLYLPNKDMNGTEFDASPWIREAIKLLAKIGGGATAFPPCVSAWLSPEGSLLDEKVTLIYTYIYIRTGSKISYRN